MKVATPEESLTGQAITDDDITAASVSLHRFLARRLHDRAQVEDVCQEAIARLLQARDRLDSAAATPYAFTVAKSILVAEARKAAVAERHAHRIGHHSSPPSPEDLALQRAESTAVTSALSSLPARDRHELLEHVIEGRPVAALAAESGGTAGGVAARLARTRARMRVDYLLAARDCDLPGEQCHPVLVALSAGDRRRQRTLEAATHLVDCDTCAALAPSLVERQRHLAALLPIPGLAVLLGRLRRWLTPRHAAVGVAASGVAVVAAVAVAMSSGPQSQPSPRPPTTAPVALPAPSPTPPLTSNGVALLPLAPEVLSAHAGQPATARSAVVQPPLAPVDGIFVGDSPTNSIFVELADPLSNTPDQPLSPLQPGQKVSFTGRLVANTPEYITDARDADHIPNVERIIALGYHIEASPSDIQPG